MKNLVWLLVLSNSIFLFSQTNIRQGKSSVIFFPQGYGVKLLNSSGTSSILNDVSNLGFMNPASISEFENYSLGLSYQFNTSIDETWIADIGTSRVYNFYPQSVGGVVKWNKFVFGLGFGQKYNGTMDIGEIQITTVQNPYGTGEFFTPIIEKSIHSYSLSTNYSFDELLQTKNKFVLGFRYNLNRFKEYDEIGELIGEAEDFFHSFNFGLFSSLSLDEARNIYFGFSYETKSDFEAKFETNSDIIQNPDPDPIRPPAYIQVEQYLIGSTPAELKIDCGVDVTSSIKFLLNLATLFWDDQIDNVKDQVEFSTSALYSFNEQFSSSLGFYVTDYKFKESYFSQLNTELNAFFITAGLKVNLNKFSVDLAIADSHLFSGDFRKQTIGKLSIGVQL